MRRSDSTQSESARAQATAGIDPELLEILVCPETKQPVHLAPQELIDRLAQEFAAGRLRTRGGEAPREPISAGLLREDGRVLYPIDRDIPVMLIEESFEIA
jgi:uncharacterized protein YbaR (Trm112 family)